MKVAIEKIHDFSTGFIQFYTIRLNYNNKTEYESFMEIDFNTHLDEIKILNAAIETIGKRMRINERYFEPERGGFALPSVSKEIKDANTNDFGIRLYCLIPNSNILILLNGGIKTKLKPEECPNVSSHFDRMIKLKAQIDRLVRIGAIDLNSHNPFEEIDEIII